MGADEDLDVTHWLTMLGMNEIRILTIDMKKVLKHAENKAGYSKNFGKGTKTELTGDGYEE